MKTHYHFIGIGGIGMSAVARLILKRDETVSGSDLAKTPLTEQLVQEGAVVHYQHADAHVSQAATVVYSSDIGEDNPEYQAALRYQCPLLHRSDLLSKLTEGHKTLAVTGTHGKTSTCALLAWTLQKAGLDPSYAIGGLLAGTQLNAAQGKGDYFVLEADESDGTFLKYAPHGAIITNIDSDHLQHFGSEAALVEAFRQFLSTVPSPQHLFWCGEDPHLRTLTPPGVSYGFAEGCLLRGSHYRQVGWKSHFDLHYRGKRYADIELTLPGIHYAKNALGVIGMALSLGVDIKKIREALRTFPGVLRRAERKGDSHSLLILDDYAHHPAEVSATLQAIRSAIGERRLIAVFQPHRYTRTVDCAGTFGRCFESADEVFITDIYAAREKPIPGVTHEQIIKELEKDSRIPCRYVPRNSLKSTLMAFVRPHDVIVTLGAGDISKLAGELAQHFKEQPPKRLTVGMICGGISVEHAVSLHSMRQTLPQIRQDLYLVKQFGITKGGKWIHDSDVVEKLEKLADAPREKTGEATLSSAVLKELQSCDLIFPLMHGTYGEDGITQGFLDVLGKAYVGCGHRAAAITMDKAVCKKVALHHGVACLPFIDFSHIQWQQERPRLIKEIEKSCTWPLYIKPTHLGSTIEVHRVTDLPALEHAAERIFQVDTDAIVESELRGREIEFAVLGHEQVTVFPPGEVFTAQNPRGIHDYEGKYSDAGTPSNPRADLPPDVLQEGMELARLVYVANGCRGLARIDFFLDAANKYWFSEINPLPGLTKWSFYPQMVQAHGLELPELIDRLFILALRSRRLIERLKV